MARGRSWFYRPRRTVEAASQTLAATGAAGAYGVDPVDGDVGYVPAGGAWRRELPAWTLEKARAYSINAYRANPMARAIIDTYTAFAVGDVGVSVHVAAPEVRPTVDDWWTDPANRLPDLQELFFRSHMLQGELLWEPLVGERTGVVRFSVIDPARISTVQLRHGNPLWPGAVVLDHGERTLEVVWPDEVSGLRSGAVLFGAWWKATELDRRGMPFLTTVMDQIDAYDEVLSNLVDRTALARYAALDVTIQGDQSDVDKWVKARGGLHMPPSGTVEVHNQSVTLKPLDIKSGADEDTTTMGAVLTTVAGGSGLAKTWLSDGEGTNRATALSMAEPVRRRVASIQRQWLAWMTEFARFTVDRAVAVGRVPAWVELGDGRRVRAAQTVTITGPEVAAADAQIQATVLLNLATALGNLVEKGVLSPEAARVAAEKAWEEFVGSPFRLELMPTDGTGDAGKVAEEIDDGPALRAV